VAGSGALAHFLSTINLERYSVNLRSQTAQEKIDKTAEFMRENLGKRFSARQLAQIAHMSPAHYSAVFRRRYDYPPLEYFNRLKIQKACQLLTGTRDPIRRIARGLGFDDPYYFSRLFKRVVGVSPNHYRAGVGRSR
jgi:AraC-like DNA-binding protein